MMFRKCRKFAALLVTLLLVLSILPMAASAADAVEIISMDISVDTVECGSDSETLPYTDISMSSEDDWFSGYEVCESESAWVSSVSGGEIVPYEGTFIGDEQYMVYITVVLNEGYTFSSDFSADMIGWEGSLQDGTVIELTADTVILTALVTPEHTIDWDTYESESSTCMTKGFERYNCASCGKQVETEKEIDEYAHVWSDWSVLTESTVLEEGQREHVCTLCGKAQTITYPRLYSNTYKPETSWTIPAAVAWQADQSVFDTAGAEVRPSTAFVYVDQDLNIYDRDHALLSDDIEAYVRKTAAGIITAFYIEDAAAGAALKAWLAETGYEDCYVVSTPANKDAVKDAADLLHVRGMLDYSELESLSRDDITGMVASVNGSHGKVVIISDQAATRENIRLLQSLSLSVWVKTPADLKSVLTQYTNGVNGVVVDDYTAAFEALEFFNDDAPSLLRLPFVIGHKGDPSNYAENTLESAAGAFEEGADLVENDIYLSADGQLFIRHDEDLNAFLGISGVSGEDLTLEEIQSYPFLWEGEHGIPTSNDVPADNPLYGKFFGGKLYGEEEGYTYRTPSLREYIERFRDTGLIHQVEIKSENPEIIGVYQELVNELDAWDQVSAITFNFNIADEMYAAYPELSVGVLYVPVVFPEGTEYYVVNDYAMDEGVDAAVERIMNTLDGWNATYNLRGLPYDIIAAAAQRGMTVWPWTYELPKDTQEFAFDYMNGMHGLTTNEPWITSDHIEVIFSQDETVSALDEVPKPEALTKVNETRTLDDAELIIIQDLNEAGTEKLAIWRYQADMVIEGENCGSYYLYSNPFTVTIEEEEPVTAEYVCTEGDGSHWTKGTKNVAKFVFERTENDSETFSRFTDIKVDGKEVSAECYTANPGSVIIELKPEYLETLSTGEHTLTSEFDDGSADAAFTIDPAVPSDDSGKKPSAPDTGDHNDIPLFGGMFALSAAVLAAALLMRRRYSN